MIKFFYYLRLFFVSVEFLNLVFFYFVYSFLSDYFLLMLAGVSINKEAVEWMVLYPMGLASWIFLTGSSVLFPDENANHALHEWPDYWKLKAHFNVGLFFAVALSFVCFVVWLLGKISTQGGAWIFSACCVSISVAAFSFYSANIELKSILIHLKKS